LRGAFCADDPIALAARALQKIPAIAWRGGTDSMSLLSCMAIARLRNASSSRELLHGFFVV
jgi:hypothetical protein